MAVPNQAGWRVRKLHTRLCDDHYLEKYPTENIYGDFERAKGFLLSVVNGFAKKRPDGTYGVPEWLEDQVNEWDGGAFRVEDTLERPGNYLSMVAIDPVTVTISGHNWKVVAEGHPDSYIKSAGKT